MSNQVYCRFPDIHGDEVVFVADDDIWLVSVDGGRAQRLTADHAPAANPRFSPDGKKIAWTTGVNGEPDVYLLSDGTVRRLTWFGSTCLVVGWADHDHVLVASGHQEVFAGLRRLYRVSLDGSVEKLPLGPAMGGAWGPAGELAVNTPNNRDSAFWKRYRGGTASALWVNPRGVAADGWQEVLPGQPAGKYSPGWVGDRLIFTSDMDGVGQLYSVTADGAGLTCHTRHTAELGYVRDARTDGTRVVYHSHGVIYVMDGLDAEPRPLRIDLGVTSPTPEDIEPVKLGTVSVDATGAGSMVEWHGGAYFITHRAGPARALVVDDSVRARVPAVLGKTGQGVVVTDADGADALEIVPLDGIGDHRRVAGGQLGRVLELAASPDGTKVALASHDGRVIVVDTADGAVRVVGRSEQGEAADLAWSPDSRYLVWRLEVGSTGSPRSQLQCTCLADGTTVALTSGTFDDFSPAFTHDGKYLAWLSRRNFDPSESAHSFALTFNSGDRVLVAPLRVADPLPFGLTPDGWALAEEDSDTDKGQKKKTEVEVVIEPGLEARAVALPVPAGEYRSLVGVKDGLAWLSAPDRGGELGATWQGASQPPANSLQRYSFSTRKAECLDAFADGIAVSGDGAYIAVMRKDEMTVLPTDRKPDDDDDTRVRVDLGRLRRRVDLRAQWRQMFDENGRLMADHFWREDMGGADWPGVLSIYRPLIDTAMTRSDVHDILYECVAELGTSHAYIIPGDDDPTLPTGYLGAQFRPVEAGFEITRVLPGESSDPRAWSPLRAAGVAAEPGDVITAVDGRPAAGAPDIGALLEGAAGKPAELTVRRGEVVRRVVVTPWKSEAALRYHDWVAARAAYVEKTSGGRLGYVHVPDMDAVGWAQLERRLGEASARDGLLADMRYNRGGYTSQLVINRLTQKVIGWEMGRHYARPDTYPAQGMRGPVIVLANQWSGSDGDIIAAVAKLHGLTVVGMRTWGGVIGIDGRYDLVDGTTVTQPRYACWFDGFGWAIENHGIDPDVAVVLPPGAWEHEDDRQLDVAIELALRQLDEHPAAVPPEIPAG
ncbi:MAG: PDZ domain-containing protein [Propionibacteriaceae bacterium]|nr:PDZ domain-containing protein [Propionibacteriaceae bacterium]